MYDIDITRDVEFAEVDGRPLLLDLYRPVVEDDVPTVVFLHGGGWMLGDRTTLSTYLSYEPERHEVPGDDATISLISTDLTVRF